MRVIRFLILLLGVAIAAARMRAAAGRLHGRRLASVRAGIDNVVYGGGERYARRPLRRLTAPLCGAGDVAPATCGTGALCGSHGCAPLRGCAPPRRTSPRYAGVYASP